MTKNTYWLADPEGNLAPVQGAEHRDHLIRVNGWTEAAEPDRHDFVWLHNVDHPELKPTRLTWEAAQLDAWAGRGWVPGLPRESSEAPAEAVELAPKSSPAPKSASSGDKKE